MALDWGTPYESPISINAGRVLGSRPMRSTLWTFGAVVGGLPVFILGALCVYFSTVAAKGNEGLAALVSTLLLIVVGPTGFWWLACMVFAKDFGQRPAEYWLGAWWRHRRLPRRLEDAALWRHHTQVVSAPRAVVEVVGTLNLRMSDDETLSSTVKRLGMFLNGLRFPVQIVVRAWVGTDGLIERRWLIAFTAATDAVLADNVSALVSGLARAGLRGHALNGDLYDTQQRCWTGAARGDKPGPGLIERFGRYVKVDGEYVRGFVMAKMPRIVDANWLAPILDGDLAVDCSLWLDPTDTGDELDFLAGRVSDWETAQVLTLNRGGYRDPDLDDAIKDASRTRMLLRRGELRVFRLTLGFVARGRTEAAMLEREAELRDKLREQIGDEALIPLDMEHDRAVLLAVPLGEPAVEYPLRTVTPAVARGYPFSNSSLTMAHGVDVGTSVGSKRQNTLDLFGLDNPHAVVLGGSGAGKGFWVKVMLWRLLHAYSWDDLVNVRIIQAEKDEYTALAEALGPERAQVVTVHSLADLPGLVYSWSGQLLAFRDLVVYDLTKMPPEDRGKAIAWLLRALEVTASLVRRPRHGLVVIDELGIVLESQEAAVAIETAYRRFRSIPRRDNPKEVNRLGMVGISQRPSDLLNHPRGKVLADLALTHVYMRQRATELKVVASKLGLSSDEQRFLDEQCEAGTGLLVADHARIGFHLYPTECEKEFAKT